MRLINEVSDTVVAPGLTKTLCGSTTQCQLPVVSTADIIREFVQSLQISEPTYTYDRALRARIKEIVSPWDFADNMRSQLLIGVTLAETSYNHIPNTDTKAAIALFCALLGYIDNRDTFDAMAAQRFPLQLCRPSPGDSSFFVALRGLLLSMWNWYSDFGANTILYGALEFINGSMLESAPGRSRVIQARTLPFVELRRNMAGVPDPFLCFIWEKSMFPGETIYAELIPDARMYINYVNDILSCYKEELEEDTDNYIYARAEVSGKRVSETLRIVIEECLAARGRIRQMLPAGPAREAWDSFETGFVSLHMVLPRYRLQELVGGEYLAVPVEI